MELKLVVGFYTAKVKSATATEALCFRLKCNLKMHFTLTLMNNRALLLLLEGFCESTN